MILKKLILFLAVLFLAFALYSLLAPALVLGAAWKVWTVWALAAWAVDKLFDVFGVYTKIDS
jgi:hypothetical protein